MNILHLTPRLLAQKIEELAFEDPSKEFFLKKNSTTSAIEIVQEKRDSLTKLLSSIWNQSHVLLPFLVKTSPASTTLLAFEQFFAIHKKEIGPHFTFPLSNIVRKIQ